MEKWKSIPNYEGLYEASNFGRIRSLLFNRYKILKPSLNTSGYLKLNLYKEKKRKTKRVHILVAETFLNHVPNKHVLVVDHKDNNKLNNKLENLQIITQRLNTSKDKKSVVGAYYDKEKNKWRAKITIKGKSKHLGYFNSENLAGKAYQDACVYL